MRHPLGGPLPVCVLLALALRAPFLTEALGSDEAGLLLVVRQWDPAASGLYGDYWVDRPPLLLAYFWLASLLPGVIGVRLLGGVVSALLVGAAVLLGHRLGGGTGHGARHGAAWYAGLVAAALSSSYLLVGHEMNGMVQGAALVLGSCCATVVAVTGRRTRPAMALAGALGLSAVLVKQNFAGGLVFGAVVVAVMAVEGRWDRRQATAAAVSFVAGSVAVATAVLAWAVAAGVDLGALWFAMYEFRLEAAETISEDSMAAPLSRLESLVVAFVVSGLALVVVLLLASLPALWRRPDTRPLVAGTLALLAVALTGIALGGSWWRHYLLQLVPVATLMTALVAAFGSREATTTHRPLRLTAAIVVASAFVSTVVGVVVERHLPEQVRVAHHVRAAAQPDDTAFVAYGNAEVLLYSGLRSPYRHLWSLPMRVLDPGLDRLVARLEGPEPPTWIVRMVPFSSWDIDRDGRLREVIRRRYRVVDSPCGYDVYLLRGVTRRLPTTDPCAPDLHLVARL